MSVYRMTIYWSNNTHEQHDFISETEGLLWYKYFVRRADDNGIYVRNCTTEWKEI